MRGAGMRWTRPPCATNVAGADGEIVWFWRPDAGAKLAERSADDGGKKARSPGRACISRKTIAQGRPDDPPVPVVLPRAFLLHADHGCGGHPAFPAPSSRATRFYGQARTHCAARMRMHVWMNVIANVLATKHSRFFFVGSWIASRSLSSGGASHRPDGSQLMARSFLFHSDAADAATPSPALPHKGGGSALPLSREQSHHQFCSRTPSITTVAFELDSGTLESRMS
jgi:hypothetical protein